MLKVFLLTLLLVAIAFIGMSISIIIKKNGKFPELHIGRNKHLKDKGISCATTQDREARMKKD